MPCRPGLWPAVLLAFVTAACHSDPKPKTLVGWRPISSWTGRGDAQTDSFNIESGQWRIKWAATNEQPAGSGTLLVTAHSAISGRPIAVAIDHKGPGSGIAYINEDPRLYHLVIESRNVDWSMKVEESEIGYSR